MRDKGERERDDSFSSFNNIITINYSNQRFSDACLYFPLWAVSTKYEEHETTKPPQYGTKELSTM